MPTTAGVYIAGLTAGTEVSSTYEGRHITLLESELIHPKRDSGFVEKGDPVCAFAPGTGGVSVGVAFNGGVATTLIAIDTEGIWNLTVWSYDDDGGIDINHGDQLYIDFFNTGDTIALGVGSCAISKISNTTTNIPFGVAYGALGASLSGVIAIKVHYDPKTTGSKGIDHVQGTAADPIVWGVRDYHVKSMVMTTGICAGYFGANYAQLTTTAAAPAGGVMGMFYGRMNLKHDVQDMYAGRFRVEINPDTPVALIGNMIVGVMGSVNLNNPGYADTIADSIKAGDFAVYQSATSTLTTGSIRALYVDISAIKKNNSGRTQGIFIKQGGGGDSYPDYGILCHLESNNLLAAMMIRTAASCVAAVGIQWTANSGRFTTLMQVDGTARYFLICEDAAAAEDTANWFDEVTSVGTPADYRLRVLLDGNSDAVRYIHLFPI